MTEETPDQPGPRPKPERGLEKRAASAPSPPAGGQAEGDEKEEESGIDPRVLLVVGIIVLIVIIVYWRQSSSREPGPPEPSTPARAAGAAAGAPGEQATAPSRPPTYAEFKTFRRQQAAEFLYRFQDRVLVVAQPPLRARQTQQATLAPRAGVFFDVTKYKEGLNLFDLYRRQMQDRMAFRDDFVPLGLPLGSPAKPVVPVFKKAAELEKPAEGKPAPVNEAEVVVGLEVDGVVKAYPKRFVYFHDVINDTGGQTPILIVYSGAAGATSAFVRKANGQEALFGCSGLVYQAANVIYDTGTMGLWSGLTGEGLTGEATGRKLEQVDVVETPWSFWRSQHPETLVMVETDPKLSIPYGPDHTVFGGDEYHHPQNTGFLYPVEGFEPGQSAQAKTVVFGVVTPEGAKAYEVAYLKKGLKLDDTIGKIKVSVTYDPEGGYAAATMADGKPLICQKSYWFAWAGNHPKTEYKGLETIPAVMDSSAPEILGPARMGGTPEGPSQPRPAPQSPGPPASTGPGGR